MQASAQEIEQHVQHVRRLLEVLREGARTVAEGGLSNPVTLRKAAHSLSEICKQGVWAGVAWIPVSPRCEGAEGGSVCGHAGVRMHALLTACPGAACRCGTAAGTHARPCSRTHACTHTP